MRPQATDTLSIAHSRVVADRHVLFTPRLPHDGYVLRNASKGQDKNLGFFFFSQSDLRELCVDIDIFFSKKLMFSATSVRGLQLLLYEVFS